MKKRIFGVVLVAAVIAMAGVAQADDIDARLENMSADQLPSGFESGEKLPGDVEYKMPERPRPTSGGAIEQKAEMKEKQGADQLTSELKGGDPVSNALEGK